VPLRYSPLHLLDIGLANFLKHEALSAIELLKLFLGIWHNIFRKKDAVSAPRVSRAHWRLTLMQRSSYVGIGFIAYRFSMCSSRYSRSMEIALSSMRRVTYQPFADLSKDRVHSFFFLLSSDA